MEIVGRIAKSYTENRPVIIKYANRLPPILPKPTLLSATVTIIDSLGNNVTGTMLLADSVSVDPVKQTVECWIHSGVAGMICNVIFTVTLSDANSTVLTDAVQMVITE